MHDRIGRGFLPMQDNACPQTAENIRRCLRLNDIAILEYSSMNPDLNSIKYLWDILG